MQKQVPPRQVATEVRRVARVLKEIFCSREFWTAVLATILAALLLALIGFLFHV